MNLFDTTQLVARARKGRPTWGRHAGTVRSSLLSMVAAAAILGLGPASGSAFAQTPVLSPAQTSPTMGLPAVPTTRVLAIGRVTPTSTPAAVGALLAQEVRDTVGLYLSGKIDQWYVRKDQAAVVFILNTSDVVQAQSMLDALPLGKAGLMTFDFIPLGPLSPLATLGRPTKP